MVSWVLSSLEIGMEATRVQGINAEAMQRLVLNLALEGLPALFGCQFSVL